MKFVKSIALTLIAALFLFSSCKNDPIIAEGALAHIPADAASVTSIDIERLMQKADFEEIKQMAFYQKVVNETKSDNPALAAALENPAASGIDLQSKIYFTATPLRANPKEMISHIMVQLSSAADFEKILAGANVAFTEENGRKYARSEGNAQAAWDDELLVFSFATDNADESMNQRVAEVFDLENEASIVQNENFRKAMATEHDIVNFMSTNALADNPTAKTALKFVNLEEEMLEDNYIFSYGDFEDGRMVGHADFLVNSSLGRGFVGRFFNKEVKTDFSKVVPEGYLSFAMTSAFDLRGIDQFLSEMPNQREYVDLVVNDFGGISRKELLQVLNGDMFVAGLSSDMPSKDDVVMALGVKSKKAIEAFLADAVAENKLKEIEPGFYKIIGFGSKDFSIRINKGIGHLLLVDDIIVLAPGTEVLEQIKNGKVNKSGLQVADNQTVTGWIDLASMQNEFGSARANLFKEMEFNINGKGADFIMETSNPNTNSLKAIFQMMNENFIEKKAKIDHENGVNL